MATPNLKTSIIANPFTNIKASVMPNNNKSNNETDNHTKSYFDNDTQ